MYTYTVAVQPTTPVQPVYQSGLRSGQQYERRQHRDETRVKLFITTTYNIQPNSKFKGPATITTSVHKMTQRANNVDYARMHALTEQACKGSTITALLCTILTQGDDTSVTL